MTLDFSRFRLKDSFKEPPPSRPPQRPIVSNLRNAPAPFIKGPIPLAWITAAAMLPGKSLQVGLALWYLAGLKKTKTVPLGNLLPKFGVDRKSKGRCLKLMERAGLTPFSAVLGAIPSSR